MCVTISILVFALCLSEILNHILKLSPLDMQKEYADVLLSLGATQSALEVTTYPIHCILNTWQSV